MIEMRTVCGSCASGDHMCGGDCQCGCMTHTDEEIEELNWLWIKWECESEED